MITGTIPSRIKTRTHSASAPMSFGFSVSFAEEKAQPTADAQAVRDARWQDFAVRLATKREAAHV
jgi:hypothetical protein